MEPNMTLLMVAGLGLAAVLLVGFGDDDGDDTSEQDMTPDVEGEDFVGTADAETLEGTEGNDTFLASWNDTVITGGGDDVVTFDFGSSFASAEDDGVVITDFDTGSDGAIADVLNIQESGSLQLLSAIEIVDDGEGNANVVAPNIVLQGSPAVLASLTGVAADEVQEGSVNLL